MTWDFILICVLERHLFMVWLFPRLKARVSLHVKGEESFSTIATRPEAITADYEESLLYETWQVSSFDQ